MSKTDEMASPIQCCQSCGVPFNEGHADLISKERPEYCVLCFKDGAFTMPDATVADMVEISLPHVKMGLDEAATRAYLTDFTSKLSRWQ